MSKPVNKKSLPKKATKKTWAERINYKQPEVKRNDMGFADIPAGSTMLIANPTIVEEYIRQIPDGCFTYIKQIRTDLAAEYKAQC